MQCLSPISIPRPGGAGASDRLIVPCSRCVACLSRKRAEWSFRLEQELRCATCAYFLTFTYEDDNIPITPDGFPTLVKQHMQLFLKRLRKYLDTTGRRVRYYLCGEYGTKTQRPHYHMIIFIYGEFFSKLGFHELCDNTWKYGFVHCGDVSPASISYTTKYCITKSYIPFEYDSVQRPFALMSRNPGLGYYYVEHMDGWHSASIRMYAVKDSGIKVSLPRYYKDKLYSSADKETFAVSLQVKLDAMERKEMQEFEHLRPAGNYFKYKEERKRDYVRRINKQVSKTDKL